MMELIKNELSNAKTMTMTENGALGYQSAGSALVDIN